MQLQKNMAPCLPFSSHMNIHHILGFLVLSVVSLGIFAPLSLSFIPHAAGLIGCALLWIQKKHISCPAWNTSFWNISRIMIAIVSLAALSSLWSVTPEISLIRSAKIGAELALFIPLLIVFYNLSGESLHIIKANLIYPLLAGALYLTFELAFDFPIARLFSDKTAEFSTWQLNKNVVALILLSPIGIFFALENKQKNAAIVLTLMCGILLLFAASQAAQLAAVIIIIAALGYRLIPSLMLPLSLGTALIIFAFMPWISPMAYDAFADLIGDHGMLREACASQRLEVWDFISKKIMENPWTGFGIDSTRSIQFAGKMVYYKDASILHPHNIALQLWIEFGALGALLGCTSAAIIYRKLQHIPLSSQRLPVIIFSSGMVVLLASWSIWSSWLIGLILLLITLCQETKDNSKEIPQTKTNNTP